jgi:hypothetical protein
VVEQAVNGLGQRIILIARHGIGGKTQLFGLLLAFWLCSELSKNARRIADRSRTGRHRLVTTALEPTLARQKW